MSVKSSVLVLSMAGALLACISPANAESDIFTPLITLGGTAVGAVAINNSGQTAGFSKTVGDAATHATSWNGTTVIDLGSLGGTYSQATDINNHGQVVGYSQLTGIVAMYALLFNGTTATVLGTLGGQVSAAYGINDVGQVVGYSRTALGYDHATVWNGTTPTDLGTLGGNHSYGAGINSAGKVVGYSLLANGAMRATLWSGGTATNLGTLGGTASQASAINDLDQVVGVASTSSGSQHATLWSGTTTTDLGTLGGTSSTAYAINNAGQVVGASATIDGNGHATLWSGNAVIDLNSFLTASTVLAGWVLKTAYGINENGQIVGFAVNTITGGQEAFVLTPIQSISFDALPALVVGGVDSLVATGGASGNAVTFSSKTPSVCNVNAATVTGVTVGFCTVAADQSGSTNLLPAPQITQNVSVGQGSQRISFGAPPLLVVGGVAAVSAVGGSSGNVVTFSSTTTSVCTVNGTTVTGVAQGTCTIEANQIGNSNYLAAPTATQGITVSQFSQNVSLTSGWNLLGNGGEASITVSASFSDSTKVATVWKWVISGTTTGITYPAWAFYTPLQSDGGKAYAASKGYEFLTTVTSRLTSERPAQAIQG
jgi:probable HAF family extracellular repeat protein